MIKLVNTKHDGIVAVLNDDTHLSRWVEQRGTIVTEGTVRHRLMPMIKPGWTVIDAGAFLGDHTVGYARAVGLTGRVMAFEPYLPSFACLMVNCRDYPQVQCYHAALSRTNGETVWLNPDANVGATHTGKPPTTIAPSQINNLCTSVTLDSFALSRCDFIKLDVEGMEPQVIQGAINTIATFKPIIYTEINHGALARYGFRAEHIISPLTKQGYRLELLDPRYGLDTPQTDVFLMPPNRT